jgi:hypothetical protein
MWLVMALAACTPGPNEDTLVDELRVLAVVAEPPEIGAGETADITVHMADPLGAGFDAIVWSCLPGERGTCLEDGTPLDQRVAVFRDGGETLSTTASAPAALAAFLAEGVDLPVPVWTLACERGLCPPLDAIAAAAEAGATDPSADALLADPYSFMADLPLTGSTLAAWTVTVTARPGEERHDNPIFTMDELPKVVAAGDELPIDVIVDGEGDAEPFVFGYATAGGFGMTAYEVDDEGLAETSWFAPEKDPGAVVMWVVLQDDRGGAAVERLELIVE